MSRRGRRGHRETATGADGEEIPEEELGPRSTRLEEEPRGRGGNPGLTRTTAPEELPQAQAPSP